MDLTHSSATIGSVVPSNSWPPCLLNFPKFESNSGVSTGGGGGGGGCVNLLNSSATCLAKFSCSCYACTDSCESTGPSE